MVKIDENKCTGCGGCIDLCPPIAVSLVNDAAVVNEELCTKCDICIIGYALWGHHTKLINKSIF